jgi:glucokinase
MRTAAAIDIGGTHTKLGIVDDRGAILARGKVETPPRGDPAALVDAIAEGLQPILQTHDVAGVGVSVAGFLDPARGGMVGNANLPALCGFPLRHALEERLRQPCVLEVDSNASAIAEYRYGAGRDTRRLLSIVIGTGVGGGVIIDGRLLRYTGECAGDLGHVIVSPTGRRCTCGATGCLEAMICSDAVAERAGGARVREVVAGARAGRQRFVDVLAETGRWLGLGLASLAPLFAPDRIVIGGGVASAGEMLLEPARVSFARHAPTEFRTTVSIVGSTLDGWEGMLGAGSQYLAPMD